MTVVSNIPLNPYDVKTTAASDTKLIQHVFALSPLVPESYDYISLAYTDGNLTGVVYKTGGSGGTTVATLTLGYSDGDLVSVTKT